MSAMPSFAIGKLLGFPLRVSVSFLLLLGVVVLMAGGVHVLPLVAVAFASVILHELGHAVVARRLGVRIKEIELHFFGGAAKMIDMPRRPEDEVAIAAAGPAVSFALAVVAYALLRATGFEPLLWVALVNVGIAVFNLLPALPMDGGRILRALLSRRLGHLLATEWAVKVSRVLAIAMALVGLFTGYLHLAALAVLLWVMGSSELRLARLQAARQQGVMDPLALWQALLGGMLRRASESRDAGPERAMPPEVEYLPPGTRTGSQPHERGRDERQDPQPRSAGAQRRGMRFVVYRF